MREPRFPHLLLMCGFNSVEPEHNTFIEILKIFSHVTQCSSVNFAPDSAAVTSFSPKRVTFSVFHRDGERDLLCMCVCMC